MYRLILACLVLVSGLCQFARSQTMTVHTTTGQQSFNIGNIDSITFTGAFTTLAADWVSVPAGPYTYGPGDTVRTIAYSYAMMKYEVTNAQYRQYLQEALAAGEITVSGQFVQGLYTGDTQWPAGTREFYLLGTSSGNFGQFIYTGGGFQLTPDSTYANHPVENVTWFGAWAFAKHYTLRLPTEDEWEKSARGNTGNDYPWGNTLANGDANLYGAGNPFPINGTTPVGYYNGSLYGSYQTVNRPSPYGAYDMTGNVWEWTDNFFSGDRPTERVVRGNSWFYYPTDPGSTCSWFRRNYPPTVRNGYTGFRCARSE